MAISKLVRLVVADDDAKMCALLASLLRGVGYDVAELNDGTELLRYIERLSRGPASQFPAAILSDIRMPGVDGLTILGALRTLNLGIPVILITGFADGLTHAKARELGAALVLDKPFFFAQLRAAVEQLTVTATNPT